jgi:tRNA threonylcarbamoyladenosine biosynthesis protein TsaB
MRVLALDTTTREGSVALVEDDRVVEERSGDGSRTHAERLPSELAALVASRGVAWIDIDLFAVASGPGSFTGMRVGIATIQGLAFVNRRRVVAVGALDALAQVASADRAAGTIVAAWMDAHRRDVFTALYRVADAPLFTLERLAAIEAPSVGDPVETLARWSAYLDRGSVFIGDGALKYRDAIARGAAGAEVEPPPLLAGAIGRIALARAARGDTLDPAGIQPLYVRRPDAEIDREKKRSPR